MCGLAASLDTAEKSRVQEWALPYMQHRGPDGSGTVIQREAGLVLEHCRLAIIDPENQNADQPFSDPSGRWTLVYNGELFNYRELRAKLERRGVELRTDCDTEILLHSLIQDGEAALPTLRGMFGFVLWDSERRELLAARDHIGVKPLYYTFADGLFIAASELRTIVAHPHVRAKLDPAAVVEYLAFGFVSGERTLLDGIRKVRPGHALRLRDGRIDVHEFWDVLPQPVGEGGSVELGLLERLDAAVAAALVSDVPISLMLSGGLDSSAIAALAAKHINPRDLTAYSVAFGLADDEANAAARLARDLGLQHREIKLAEEDVVAEFDPWLNGLDVPTANPTWIAVSAIARAVRADGMKVLLSGDGGDELLGGYNRWMTYLRFHDVVWTRTPRVLRRAGGRLLRPFAGGLAGDIARRASTGGELFVGSRPFHDDDLGVLLGPVALQAAADEPPERPVERLRARFDESFPDADYLTWMSYAALKMNLVEDYLVRLDTMGMRHSVEGRVPLLDAPLARWTMSIPQRVKIDGYRPKHLFRSVVSPFLPDYVTSRQKQGFCPPVASWVEKLVAAHPQALEPLVEFGLITACPGERLQRDRAVESSFARWALHMLAAWSANIL